MGAPRNLSSEFVSIRRPSVAVPVAVSLVCLAGVSALAITRILGWWGA